MTMMQAFMFFRGSTDVDTPDVDPSTSGTQGKLKYGVGLGLKTGI